ncbi:hypothetical protein B0H14DRAFT_2812531 [Mycena olivaceomarginata]|nr:hypothetical protein B0H14DRAFT_2812531 [Mycena olivaceomarginata]
MTQADRMTSILRPIRKYFPRGTTLALRSLRAKVRTRFRIVLFDHIHSLIHISFSSAPSLTGLQVFGIQPAPPGQYYCTSERYIAAMYDLLDQLGSIVGNIHSISDTFIVPDGIAGGVLLDVIMLPGSKPGICFSDIPGRHYFLCLAMILPCVMRHMPTRD